MPKQTSRRIAWSLVFLGFLPVMACPAPARAQSGSGQQDSVADAARRARAEKQKPQKPAKVVTTDDLGSKPGAPAEIATVPAPAAAATPVQQPAAVETPASAVNPEEQAQTAAELADLKKQLQEIQKDLDLQQREYSLQHDQVYQNPDPSIDKAGKAALDALQREVNDKEHSVESLKSRIAAVEELFKSQGGKVEAPAQPGSAQPPGEETKPAKP
jgi:hypothetical protein